jgi:hypothetical protein
MVKEGFRTKNNQSEPDPPKPAVDLVNIVTALYAPAYSAAEVDEYLHPLDLIETVSQHCDTSKEDLHHAMREAGFLISNVEGQLYWMVRYIQ